MTEMTGFGNFLHVRARKHNIYTCHFCHKEEIKEEKVNKIKGLKHDSFFGKPVILLSHSCHQRKEI